MAKHKCEWAPMTAGSKIEVAGRLVSYSYSNEKFSGFMNYRYVCLRRLFSTTPSPLGGTDMKTLTISVLAALALAGTALAAKPVTTDDYDPYAFTYSCDGFDVSGEGLNTGTHTIYFDNQGHPVRNVAHHNITETHTNLLTGRVVEFRGHYMSTYVYAEDTQTFTGAFLIANEQADGTLLQETGLVELNHTTGEIRSAGRHDILDLPYDPFCAALAD
jgi:hypothetical protein